MKRKSAGASAESDVEIGPTPPEFFKKAVVGKYHKEYAHGQRVVRVVTLEADVAREFATAREVNMALRLVQKMRRLDKAARQRKSA